MATGESQVPAAIPDKPPPPKRWIPLSLRMFVTMLLCVGIGGPVWIGIRLWRQDETIRKLRKGGWEVRTSDTGPTWLRSRLSEDLRRYLQSVDWLAFPIPRGGAASEKFPIIGVGLLLRMCWQDTSDDSLVAVDDVFITDRLDGRQRVEVSNKTLARIADFTDLEGLEFS